MSYSTGFDDGSHFNAFSVLWTLNNSRVEYVGQINFRATVSNNLNRANDDMPTVHRHFWFSVWPILAMAFFGRKLDHQSVSTDLSSREDAVFKAHLHRDGFRLFLTGATTLPHITQELSGQALFSKPTVKPFIPRHKRPCLLDNVLNDKRQTPQWVMPLHPVWGFESFGIKEPSITLRVEPRLF